MEAGGSASGASGGNRVLTRTRGRKVELRLRLWLKRSAPSLVGCG